MVVCSSSVAYSSVTPDVRSVSVRVQEQPLENVLQIIADQLNIDISLAGTFPKTKESIDLLDVPLEQAIGRVMQLYGITNHAAIYDSDASVVFLTILESSVHSGQKFKHNISEQFQKESGRLNDKQVALLQEQKKNSKEGLLTLGQIERLKKEISLTVSEKKQSVDLLTSEQINKLQTGKIFESQKQILTNNQIRMLKEENKMRVKAKSNIHSSILLPKQIERLKKAIPQKVL